MRKFVKLGIGMVLIVICLLLFWRFYLSSNMLSKSSDVFKNSKVILSPAVEKWFDNNDLSEKELEIRAYDNHDVLGLLSDSVYADKYREFELKKMHQIAKAQTDISLSEKQFVDVKAQIEAEFQDNIQELENQFQSAKYSALCRWFVERGVSASQYRREENGPVLAVLVYSVEKKDLVALKDSGLHICYMVDKHTTGLVDCFNEEN